MAEPHAPSYYAASVGDVPTYPALEGSHRADVCVIGGGFSGLATALTLAERGRRVILLEANRIGWGASGRNGGQVIAGISGEDEIVRQLGRAGRELLEAIRYRGHDIIAERIARYQIDCDWKSGWIEVAARPKHMAAIRRHVEERIAAGEGAHIELVEKSDLRSIIDTPMYHGGYIDRRSGHLHPLKLAYGEARAAASLGVLIFEDSAVVEFQGGTKPFARTAHGRVDADAIVLAGDTVHTFERGRLFGLQFPTGSYIIATEPLGEELARRLNPQDLAICDSNLVLDYYRLSADRRMLFGGRCNYSNRDPGNITATMKKRLVEIFPQLADKRIDYTWSGRIGIVLNRVPAIGRLEPNVYFMQGYCGHGVNATHIAGEIVADTICGVSEKFDLFDRIRHIRLPIGRWAGNQLLALGMIYYRIKDAM